MEEKKDIETNERFLSRRDKNIEVYYIPDKGQYRVEGYMQDSVHHLRINMFVQELSLKIEEIECEMLQVPDEFCFNAQNSLQSMIGKKVFPGLTQELNNLPPREKCTHLTNLFHEVCYNVTLAESIYGQEIVKTLHPEITEEQMYKIFLWFKPDLRDSCARYSRESPFMQRVNESKPPEGSEKLKALAQERLGQKTGY